MVINKCINCTYFITCPKASEEIKECDKFKKIDRNVEVEYVKNKRFK